jgi:hypothetical protein
MNQISPRPAAPIESFGPELFNALIQGSQKQFKISDIPYREAVKFRHRCHMLRNRLRVDNHPMASVAAKTKISIQWDHSKVETLFNKKRVAYPKSPDAKVTLIIEPFDSEFRDALKAAGIDVHRRVDSSGTEAPPAGGAEASVPSLDNLLKEI